MRKRPKRRKPTTRMRINKVTTHPVLFMTHPVLEFDILTHPVFATERQEEELDVELVNSAPRIAIHTLDTMAEQGASSTSSSCTHEVAVPPECVYKPLEKPTRDAAKSYPFELDAFQRRAVLCIENGESVLVSAHTSAGKTVTAEYAIALCLKEKRRVIYTTPIKALSNQKYREFYEEFSDVGLMTGDVTINPNASCLIMTTEILRSMLYRGSEVTREVAWVIFDEIHYMRDAERGVVWEETLILLPDAVRFVFLSATIPNARQFAEWIAHLHKQPCHVVYTDYRPTPLQHFVYPAGGDGIHLVVDERGNFKDDNFNRAMSALQGEGGGQKGGGKKGEGSACFKVVKMIMERNFAPVIVFSFSKKECESYALQMAKLDFNSPEEKKLVEEVFNNATMVLKEEDRALPQVENVLPLLRRGIGIHHGGLLPILKETTEILFGEGLIKALFATETFAMGLNMPARTVMFTGAQKFDGKSMRWVSSGEYIQMSGRAGRRGKDSKGLVILMVDDKMSPEVGKNLVKGAPDPINSAFHLTYNMVLNLLRVEEINPEYMMERSFHQFQNYSNVPKLLKDLKDLEQGVAKIKVANEEEVASYYGLKRQLQRLSEDFRSWLVKPQYAVPFMQAGRLISVKSGSKDFGWGVVVHLKKVAPKEKSNPLEQDTSHVVYVLLHVTSATAKCTSAAEYEPCSTNASNGELVVVPVNLNLVQKISSVKVFIPKDVKSRDNRKVVLKSLKEVKKRFKEDKIPLLDPIKDMKITEKEFKDIVKRIAAFEKRLESHPLHGNADLKAALERYGEKDKLSRRVEDAKSKVKQAKSLLRMTELKCMKRVLRRLGYCSTGDVIEVKGRIACELSSADELLLTEMIFDGLFNDLTAAQSAAVLSCFVFDEKSTEMPRLSETLTGPLRKMQEMARRIAKVSRDCKLDVDEEAYVESFKPFMMDVVHEWCNGASFAQLCKMTDVFEGSIIRCMRRLEELLRQMVQAAKNIGNADLENKFAEAIKLLKRDIIFAASLYL